MTVIEAPAYSLLSNLVAPSKPASLSYGELNWDLSAHLKPKPLIIAERFRFHRRNQAEREVVPQYLAGLRRLADRCKFGNHLEEALRDRLVCGITFSGLLTLEGLTRHVQTIFEKINVIMALGGGG